METTEKPQHIGRKIARIRELRGMKQEALAQELGISQQAISKIEQSEAVDKETLERVAKALGISSKAIENFSEETLFLHIESIHDQGVGVNYQCTFNPIEKIVELYERLLEAEKEKNEILREKGSK